MKKTVTLIELIISMVVLSVAITPILVMISEVVIKHAKAEYQYKAIVLGRDKMEEILAKKFNDIEDDIGINTTQNGGYTITASIYYVDPDDTSAYPKVCDGILVSYPLDCKVAVTKDYLRIDITVTHKDVGNMNYSTIVSKSH